ncbi:MAG: dihydrofolate reductase [Planctomycetota bacterium]|jgi:D-3-phosphoglycerate dehydrogenase|nr:dihydrofolate reductase [Planctomycetota bacterium]
MKKRLSQMVELDAPTLEYLAEHFTLERFSMGFPDRDLPAGEEETREHLQRFHPEVVVTEFETFNDQIMEVDPDLRLLASVRAVPRTVDLAAAKRRGVAVTNAPGRNARAVVEMTLGFIINLARFIPQTHHELMSGRLSLKPGTPVNSDDILWRHPDLSRDPYVAYRGIEIDGRTLGLVGFGMVGAELAVKATALGMRVIVFDPYQDAAKVAASGAKKVDSLAELLSLADFVSLHAKVTPETRGMFNWECFSQMKPEAYFINTARGALVVQSDLVRALREKRIAGAALDVYDQEPQYDDSPLFTLDNLIMTPHIGGATRDVIRHQSRLVRDNIAAFLANRELPNRVG